MAYFEFPHTREYEGDLGYIIKKLLELTDKYNTFFEYNSIRFHDPIEWDIATSYPAFNIVMMQLQKVFILLSSLFLPVLPLLTAITGSLFHHLR